MRAVRVLTAAVLAAALPIGLSGCGVSDVLQKRISGTSDSRRQVLDAWTAPASAPDWVPADATRIRYVAGTAGERDRAPGAVRVDSAGGLPSTCTTVRRFSLDAFGEDWAVPVADLPERVQRCGNWIVVPARGGWFGWTPLSPREREQR